MNQYFSIIKKNYFNFTGYSNRKEFWSFFSIYFIFLLLLGMIDLKYNLNIKIQSFGIEIPTSSTIYKTIFFLPISGIIIRRLNDVNRSAYWYWIVLFYTYCLMPIILIYLYNNFSENSINIYNFLVTIYYALWIYILFCLCLKTSQEK